MGQYIANAPAGKYSMGFNSLSLHYQQRINIDCYFNITGGKCRFTVNMQMDRMIA